jgi:hypothetical protein
MQLQKPDQSDIYEVLLKGFKHERSKNVSVSSPLLTAKAHELANLLSNGKFVHGAGWIDSFKLHHISCEKVSSNITAVNCDMRENGLVPSGQNCDEGILLATFSMLMRQDFSPD